MTNRLIPPESAVWDDNPNQERQNLRNFERSSSRYNQ